MDQFKVIFAPRAERNLKSITFRIARYSSSEIAERFGNRLIHLQNTKSKALHEN